ncbi:MAG: DUF501 domain-containing protein [Actinomycetota bacterium]
MDDSAIVEAQLGRAPRGRWTVTARCHLGIPMAIENHPRLDDGSPFPTLFWLTCPVLVKRASRLEASGFMADLTHRLERDGGLRARLGAALARYRASRDRHEVIDDADAPPGGGPARVKCLHAHLAHQISDGPNPVGAITLASAGWPDCRIACVESRP